MSGRKVESVAKVSLPFEDGHILSWNLGPHGRNAGFHENRPAFSHRFSVSLAVLLTTSLTLHPGAFAQSLSDKVSEDLRNRIESAGVPPRLAVARERIHASKALPLFYERRAFRPAWSGDSVTRLRTDLLIEEIRNADSEGLDASDYHLAVIDSVMERILETTQGGNALDPGLLVDLDLLLTDAFMVYGSHLLAGRMDPETIDPEWVANRRDADMVLILEKAIESDQITAGLRKLLPPQSGYARLKKALAKYRALEESGGWPTIPEGDKLQVGDSGPRIRALRARLSATGDLNHSSGNDSELFDEALEQAVADFQRRHGLETDGVVGRQTLAALNVPASKRKRQIEINMERWRWLPQDLGKRYVLVNIADFELDVVEDGRTVMAMRVIVGRDYRRTPVFSDNMTHLVLCPYWNVPPGIASSDIIPAVRKDPGYLASKNIKVFQGWGTGAGPLDAGTIDWSGPDHKNLGYRFRQDPGPTNSLGRVKFMFPNKFNVYLHDTPSTELFEKTERTFSSGCIRVQRPLELAEYVLGGDAKWSRDRLEEAILTWKEQTVPLPEPIPVHLQYWTAWCEDKGIVHFRKDVYGRDIKVDNALGKAAPTL